MKGEQALVPKLRFGEFESEWAAHSLKSLLTHVVDNRGKTPPTEKQGIPLIEANAVGDRKINYSVCSKYVTQSTFNDWFRKYLDSGDTVFTTVGSTAECSFYIGEKVAAIAQNLVGLRFGKQNSAFMFYAISTKSNQEKFKRIQMGAVQPSIKVSQMIHIKLDTPSLPEQEKIAAFLTSVDDRIDQLKRKKSLLQYYKKGAMQKLFSQELRFKDEQGKDFPDWEEKRVCDMFTVTRGKVLAVPKMNSEPDDEYKYPVFSSQTKQNGLTGYYNQFLFKNAITWTTDGANAGDVKYRKGQFYCTNVCGVLLSDQGYANTFVASALNTVTHKYVSYVGNPKLMSNVMSEILISVPTSIPEQTKIANFLSSLDQKIEQIDTQITQTQSFKKGLLQQMFA
jgi:type I restriction enzyme S subunit